MGGFRLNNTRHLLGLGLVGGLVHVRLLELDELLELDGTLLLGVLVGILLMTPTQAVCETSASPCSRKAWRDSGCCWASCSRRHSGVVPRAGVGCWLRRSSCSGRSSCSSSWCGVQRSSLRSCSSSWCGVQRSSLRCSSSLLGGVVEK